MTTHSWLENDAGPSSWAPPRSGATPPPPPPPAHGDAPTPPPAPPLPAVVPLPATPAPLAAAPTSAPPDLTPSLAPERPMSGYDAPTPDSRWHTYLQRGEQPNATLAVRPRALVPGAMLLVGGALAVVGSLLTWATFPDAVANQGVARTFNGFTELAGESKDGPFFVGFAALLAVFGVTLLLAKRVAAVLILGAILAGFGAIAAAVDLLDIADPDGVELSVGIGLPIVVGGFVLAFAGSIVGLLTRRAANPGR